MQTFKIPVIVRTQDNGDGGYSIYVYNTAEELLQDHPKRRTWAKKDDGTYGYVDNAFTQEAKDKILNEDDPYENGYISNSTLEISLENGVATLTKMAHFHAGQ